MIEDSMMFFIITGNYKVQSVMFDMKNKKKDLDDTAFDKKPKIPSKVL